VNLDFLGAYPLDDFCHLVDCLATDLIELSTRHNFVYFLAVGAIDSGWARSASGDPAEGIARIEQGNKRLSSNRCVRGLSYYLSLKGRNITSSGSYVGSY
jgi:hypothetical protein